MFAGKRIRSPEGQRLRDEGQHPVLPGCVNSCKKQCTSKFSSDMRGTINRQYWALQSQRRRDWLKHSCIRQLPKQLQRTSSINSRRSNTIQWKLEGINVCKPFFLTTLGYKPTNDRIVRSVLEKSDSLVGAPSDKRGKHPPRNKFSDEERNGVKSHIESYRPCVSHYRLEYAPNRRYLSSELTVYRGFEYCDTFNLVQGANRNG